MLLSEVAVTSLGKTLQEELWKWPDVKEMKIFLLKIKKWRRKPCCELHVLSCAEAGLASPTLRMEAEDCTRRPLPVVGRQCQSPRHTQFLNPKLCLILTAQNLLSKNNKPTKNPTLKLANSGVFLFLTLPINVPLIFLLSLLAMSLEPLGMQCYHLDFHLEHCHAQLL